MNTNMTGFRCVFFILCALVLGTKVASALEGLRSQTVVRDSVKVVEVLYVQTTRPLRKAQFLKQVAK